MLSEIKAELVQTVSFFFEEEEEEDNLAAVNSQTPHTLDKCTVPGSVLSFRGGMDVALKHLFTTSKPAVLRMGGR